MGRTKLDDRRAVWTIGIASLLLQIPFLDRGLSPMDEGSVLAIARALGDGQVLYRDQATFIGPLMYELMGALLALFGPDLIVGRIFQALVFTGTVVLSYRILRSFTGVLWAAIASLSLCVLKPLAFPLWTIPNYSQLAMLSALTACAATLRFVARHESRSLALAGFAVGVTVITKLSLGAAIAVAVAAAVALDSARGVAPSARKTFRRILVIGTTGVAPVALTLVWYAAHGALGALADRTVLALGEVSTTMRVPPPSPWAWTAGGDDLFRLQYSYFPPPVFNWMLLRDVELHQSWAGPLIEQAVKLAYYGPLFATMLAFFAAVRELRSESRTQAACGWLLLAGFSSLSYVSTAHRLDFAHVLNIAPAPFLVSALALHRWAGRSVGLVLPALALAAWLTAGGFASRVVFDANDTPLETRRGRLFVTSHEAEDGKVLLDFLDRQPRDARILLLRTIPIFYFLADRPIIGLFDLYLPGYFREGEDARTAREIENVDFVVYNPNELMGIPEPITQFAPLTARALADRFEIVRILSPTAVLLAPATERDGARVTIAEIAREFERVSTRAPAGRVEAASWLMYPVVRTIVREDDRSTCFTYPHDAEAGDLLSVRPMFKHEAWTHRYWHDAARRVHAAIVARAGNARETLFTSRFIAGLPGPPVEIPLDRYAGQRVRLEFCAERFPGKRGVATFGWGDARIVRQQPDS